MINPKIDPIHLPSFPDDALLANPNLQFPFRVNYDLGNWRDGSGVPPFEQVGEIAENGDGTVTVKLRSRRRLQEERSRAFFRLLVEVVRPPGVILTE